MARVGNEATLILKLAKSRSGKPDTYNEPNSFKDGKELHEAYMMGLSEGFRQYKVILDTIVYEMETR